MFNNHHDADSGFIELEDRLRTEGNLSEESWSFELSYNHDEEAYSLIEVFRQRMGDQTASYWRWLGNLEIASDWFQSATRSVASGFDLLESVVDEDLRRHIQRYEGLLMEGNRVLVVTHSQGNLYANAATPDWLTRGCRWMPSALSRSPTLPVMSPETAHTSPW